MEKTITFEDMPKAMVQLMAKLEEIETKLEEILYNFRLHSKILLKLSMFLSILEKKAFFAENFEYRRKNRNG